MIYLFLDTTALHLSWRLNGTGWDSIQDAIKLDIATVATSTITFAELERQASQDAVEVSKSFEQLARDLYRHHVEIVPSPVTFDAEKWRRSFATRLSERGVDVIDRANPSHDVLLDRDLGRVPPFKQSGDGYRDALIWLTFLEWIGSLEVSEEDQLYFVSNNTRQFLDGGKKDALIHPYLRDEVHAISKLNLELLPDIEAVVARVRPPAFTKKQETKHTTGPIDDTDREMDENWTSTEELALQRARSESNRLLGSSIDHLNLLKESAPRGYTVDGVPFPPIETGEITAVELTGAEEAFQSDVLDGTELWTVDLDASIEVEGALLKQDASEIPEAGTVLDADWNRHYMMVSFPLTIRLRYDVRVDSAETTDGQLVDVTLLSSGS